MTQQGQWGCVGPDRALAYKIWILAEAYRLRARPNGWNLTDELEAPNDANSKLQEIVDTMMTEK